MRGRCAHVFGAEPLIRRVGRSLRRVAQEIKPEMLVNLGIGLPSLVANYLPRDVHVFFQAENGVTRLKKEVEAMAKQHPEIPIEDWIFFSEPPEGGLPAQTVQISTAMPEWVCSQIRPPQESTASSK